jgi:hypothetical protein
MQFAKTFGLQFLTAAMIQNLIYIYIYIYRYITETRLHLTFHSVVLDVHVFQTKAEFVAIQLLKALHFETKIPSVFICGPNCFMKIFFLDKNQ